MSSYLGDIANSTGAIQRPSDTQWPTSTRDKKDNTSLDMTDFLTLMVAQFQNQTMDDAASTSDMLNQLVQMSVVQAITDITDASVMQYAGSLVGKEVTIGEYDQDTREMKQIIGQVEATGTYSGEQVIYVNGKRYNLSDIMAIGRLPENAIQTPGEDADKTEETQAAG